jgi:hypothetical protein
LSGTATPISRIPTLPHIRYVGKPYPYRTEVPISLVIEIDKARYKKEPFEHRRHPA